LLCFACTAGARRYIKPGNDASSSSERRLNPHHTTAALSQTHPIPLHGEVERSDDERSTPQQ
jgi:hypothetical protein